MPRRRKLPKIAYRFLWRPKNAIVSVDLEMSITTSAFATMDPQRLADEFVAASRKCLGHVEGHDFRIIQDSLFPGGIIATGKAGVVYLE